MSRLYYNKKQYEFICGRFKCERDRRHQIEEEYRKLLSDYRSLEERYRKSEEELKEVKEKFNYLFHFLNDVIYPD